MEIKRELWRLTEDKRNQNFVKQQQARDRVRIEARLHGTAIAGRVRRHLYYSKTCLLLPAAIS